MAVRSLLMYRKNFATLLAESVCTLRVDCLSFGPSMLTGAVLAATPRQAGRGTLVLDRSRSAFATPPDAALLRLRLQRQVYLLTLRLTVLRHRLSANSRRESVRTPLRCPSPAPVGMIMLL